VTRGYGACRWLQRGNGGAGQECSQTTTYLQLHSAIVTCISVLAASSPQDRRRARDETLYPATCTPCLRRTAAVLIACRSPPGIHNSRCRLPIASGALRASRIPLSTPLQRLVFGAPLALSVNGRPPPIDQPKSCHRHALILPRPRPLLLPLHPTCACPPPHNHRTAPYTRSHVATSLLPADPRARLLCPVAQLPAPRRELPGPRGHSWYVCDAQNAVANTPQPY
jgi:hypothetical protein